MSGRCGREPDQPMDILWKGNLEEVVIVGTEVVGRQLGNVGSAHGGTRCPVKVGRTESQLSPKMFCWLAEFARSGGWSRDA